MTGAAGSAARGGVRAVCADGVTRGIISDEPPRRNPEGTTVPGPDAIDGLESTTGTIRAVAISSNLAALPEDHQGELKPGRHPDLFENARQMVLDGLLGDAELGGDVTIAPPLSHGPGNLHLARCQ